MKMMFQEIRIIATGPCITNQLNEAKRNKNGYRGVSRDILKSSAGLELKNNPS